LYDKRRDAYSKLSRAHNLSFNESEWVRDNGRHDRKPNEFWDRQYDRNAAMSRAQDFSTRHFSNYHGPNYYTLVQQADATRDAAEQAMQQGDVQTGEQLHREADALEDQAANHPDAPTGPPAPDEDQGLFRLGDEGLIHDANLSRELWHWFPGGMSQTLLNDIRVRYGGWRGGGSLKTDVYLGHWVEDVAPMKVYVTKRIDGNPIWDPDPQKLYQNLIQGAALAVLKATNLKKYGVVVADYQSIKK
jgi:hypothetical protein